MDIYKVILVILVFILSCFLTKERKKNKAIEKGIEGEREVKKILKKLPREYIVLNDLFINYKDRFAQIDHVILSNKGIFVIETKNYSGKIYGDKYIKYWIQKLNGRKNKFYSPIWQNKTHINAIKFLLKDYRDVPIYSVIVFCGRCNIKKVKSDGNVIHVKRLKRYIKRFKSDIFIKNEQILNISTILKNNNMNSKKIRKKHIKMIKKEYI